MKTFKRPISILLTIMLLLSSFSPLTVSADNLLGDIEHRSESNSEAYASGGGGGGEGGGVSVSAEAMAEALAIIKNGRYVELSAYYLESIQGLNRGTFVPELDKVLKSPFLDEYEYSAIKDTKYFGKENKRDSIFKQDGNFSLDYIEALNWLYKNDLIHNFESITISVEEPEGGLESIEGSYEGEVVSGGSGGSGGQPEDVKGITLPAGTHTVVYDMYSIPDRMRILDRNGKELATTGGEVSGKGTLEFTLTKTERVSIIMNEGDGRQGTAWQYVLNPKDVNLSTTNKEDKYPDKAISTVTLTELSEKDSYLYPVENGIALPIERKNFIMQLMKVVDGVEWSRPLLIESRYQYRTLNGFTLLKSEVEEVMKTKFKNQIGSTGMDSAINDIDIDFKKYGMHKYYVNPNVYELYFAKAYNSGIIKKSEISDTQLLRDLSKTQGFAGSDIVNFEGVKCTLDLLEEQFETTIDSEFILENIAEIKKLENDFEIDCTEVIETMTEDVYGDKENDEESILDKIRRMFGLNGKEDEEDGQDKDGRTPTHTNGAEDELITIKLGKPIPKWHNSLGPVRINTTRLTNNDGDYNISSGSQLFGNSWTDISQQRSNIPVDGTFEYNKDHEYFKKKHLSYIDAVMYAYRAINAYSDEKLPQREVDIIMSMYSINYGRLSQQEVEALNYLIAKGIIDGDNAAKYTSTENITVEDAIVLLYRIANPSARLTFKQVYEPIDQSMLERGFVQSKTSLKPFSDTLPEMEVNSTEKDEYIIIMNPTLTKNFYLGEVKHSRLDIDGLEEITETVTHEDLLKLGLILDSGEYTIKRVKIPWNANLTKLGFTTPQENPELPDWINIELGGGYYFIEEDILNGETRELRFQRIYTSSESFNEDTFDYTYVEDEEEKFEKMPYEEDGRRGGDKGNADFTDCENTDDCDPLGILSYNEPSLIEMKKYLNDGDPNSETVAVEENETVKIYLGINEKTKSYIMLDGEPLFINGQVNQDLIQKIDSIESIVQLTDVPKDSNGTALFGDDLKVFLEFTLPKTGQRSINDYKTLLKRRLTLSGEAEIKDEDIASYTSSENGETMISMKELKRFGITTSKEEPDVLFHESTNTYAYLNPEKSYALISNTVMKFPEGSLMIEISADDVYYNIKVIMSMLNDKDFYVFNDEGKVEIVTKMTNIREMDIYNPETDRSMDKTYMARVDRFLENGEKNVSAKDGKVEVGRFINISAISGTPATFFLSMNHDTGIEKLIYGFEPYYIKTPPLTDKQSYSTEDLVRELTNDNSNVIHIENLLINNAVLRNEFFIPKNETFVYADNALKITNLTESESYEYYAETYLKFITSIVEGLNEKDVKVNIDTFKESNPFMKNRDFELVHLLERGLLANEDNVKVKQMVANVKKGIDREAFWTLYFMSRFKVTMPYEKGVSESEATGKFETALLEIYKKKFPNTKFTLESVDDLKLLMGTTSSETNIYEKRVYNFKRIKKAPNNGMITTDYEIFINRNNTVYIRLVDFGANVSYRNNREESTTLTDNKVVAKTPNLKIKDNTFIEMKKYLSNLNSSLTEEQLEELKFQKDILGNSFYLKGNKIYAPLTTQYASLPENEKPLELYPNGTRFYMETENGKEQFIIINNSVTMNGNNQSSGNILIKVARVNTKPLSSYSVNGNTDAEKLFNYYADTNNYLKSIKTLGKYSTAVHKGNMGLEYTIRSSELFSSLQDTNSLVKNPNNNVIYFDTSNKKNDTIYVYGTDFMFGKNRSIYLTAYPRDIHSLSITNNVNSPNTKLIFSKDIKINFNSASNLVSNSLTENSLYSNKDEIKEEYMVYESFLFDYGTISLNQSFEASINKRSNNILKSSPVLTDIVDELVKAVKKDRTDVKPKTVGDLVNGDRLLLVDTTNGQYSDFVLLKTSTDSKNGYSHFITISPMTQPITPLELEDENALLVKNFRLLDGIKIPIMGERKSLYYFIGNRQLNLATPSDLREYKDDLEFPTLGTQRKLLTEQLEGNKMVTKQFTVEVDVTTSSVKDGTVTNISNDEKGNAYPYHLSIYLDSNLLVEKNDLLYYEIIGYASDGLINTKAFTSRADRFEGVFNSLLTVLPTYSNIEGKFLGFDLSSLEIDHFKRLFTLEYWKRVITNGVYNAEQVLSALGIYYVYTLLVLVILGRAFPAIYRFVLNPIKLLTLGRLDMENLNMLKFVTGCITSIVLLTLTYNGFIRVLIWKAEEVRQVFLDYFIYPFL